MWTLVVFVCSVQYPDQCIQTGPTAVFDTREECVAFFDERSKGIDKDNFKYDYQCLNWNVKT